MTLSSPSKSHQSVFQHLFYLQLLYKRGFKMLHVQVFLFGSFFGINLTFSPRDSSCTSVILQLYFSYTSVILQALRGVESSLRSQQPLSSLFVFFSLSSLRQKSEHVASNQSMFFSIKATFHSGRNTMISQHKYAKTPKLTVTTWRSDQSESLSGGQLVVVEEDVWRRRRRSSVLKFRLLC